MKVVLKIHGIWPFLAQAVQLNRMEDEFIDDINARGNANSQPNLNRNDSSDIDKQIRRLELEKEIEMLKQQNLEKESENLKNRNQKKSKSRRARTSSSNAMKNRYQGHAFRTDSESERYPKSDYANPNVSCQGTAAENSSGPEDENGMNAQDITTDSTTSELSPMLETSSGTETDTSSRQAVVEASRDISSRPVLRRVKRLIKVVAAIVVIYFSGKYMYRWVAKMSRFKNWKRKAKSKMSNVVSQAKDLLDEPQDLLQVENTLNPKKARAAMFNTFEDPENVLDQSMLPPPFRNNFQPPRSFGTSTNDLIQTVDASTFTQAEITRPYQIRTANAMTQTSSDTTTYDRYALLRKDISKPVKKSASTGKTSLDDNVSLPSTEVRVKEHNSTMTIPPSSKTTGIHCTSKTNVAKNETPSFGQISIPHLMMQIVSLDIQFGLLHSIWSYYFPVDPLDHVITSTSNWQGNETEFGIDHYSDAEIKGLTPDGWAAKHTNLNEYIGWRIVKVNSRSVHDANSLYVAKQHLRRSKQVIFTLEEKKLGLPERIMPSGVVSWLLRIIAFIHLGTLTSELHRIEQTNVAIRNSNRYSYIILAGGIDFVMNGDSLKKWSYTSIGLKHILLGVGWNVGHALFVPPVLIWPIIFGNKDKS